MNFQSWAILGSLGSREKNIKSPKVSFFWGKTFNVFMTQMKEKIDFLYIVASALESYIV